MKNILFSRAALLAVCFFAVSCGGSKDQPAPQPSAPTEVSGTAASPPMTGEDVYKKTCVACHQLNGEGIPNAFPPLAKSDFLINRTEVIRQVLHGKTGEMIVNGITYNGSMPPQVLSDEEIARVLTYVYSSWGNSGKPVTVEEVKATRSLTP